MKEFSPQNTGEQIVDTVEQLNDWSRQREHDAHGSRRNIRRKLARSLGPLLEQARDKQYLVQSPSLLMYDTEDNLLLNQGQFSGELVSFQYTSYPSRGIGDHFDTYRSGIVGVFATRSMHTPGFNYSPESWGQVSIENSTSKSISQEFEGYKNMGTIPVLVPFDPKPRLVEISNSFPLNTSPDMIAENNPDNLNATFNPSDYLERMTQITQGANHLHPVSDGPKIQALYAELEHINISCPYFRKPVVVESRYMRSVHPEDPARTVILAGEASGILRKFVYEPYFPKNQPPIVTLQAVIYSQETHQLVEDGKITPQEADVLPTTLKIPIDRNPTIIQM